MNKLVSTKNNKKKKWDFKFIKITNKNFPTNPRRGGIPTSESNEKITIMKKKLELEKIFKLFKEEKLSKLKRKKIKKRIEREEI